MRKPSPVVTVVALMAFLDTSCVLMMRDNKEELSVHSLPNGADVQIDGFNTGRSPLRTVVKRESHTVRVTKDGYLPAERRVNTKVSGAAIGWTIGGVLLWGIFEALSLTDMAKYRNLDPNELTVTLEPLPAH